jgi:acetyl esterase/lipase
MADQEFLEPFVVAVEPVEPERDGAVDLYLPAADGPRPAVVFVHGGPLPPTSTPRPREWPVYRGYGSLVAARGVVGVTLDHDLVDVDAYPLAAGQVVAAVDRVRRDPRVDADRVALWFFSGGGPLSADWLRDPPAWLRCVALTYPLLGGVPGFIPGVRFRPADAVEAVGVAAAAGVAGAMRANALPILLTRVGLERPAIADTVATFVATARDADADLTIVDVPRGRHSFDIVDHTDESRRAVETAVERVVAILSAGPPYSGRSS